MCEFSLEIFGNPIIELSFMHSINIALMELPSDPIRGLSDSCNRELSGLFFATLNWLFFQI